MKKIPTLFVRDPDDRRHVLPEVTPGCEWVLAGEGVARRKYDGTCIAIGITGEALARREVKAGKEPPPNFIAEEHDPTTGKTVGWEPFGQSPWVKWWPDVDIEELKPGTYELCGPRINGNPEDFDQHTLVRHDTAEEPYLAPKDDGPLTFDWLAWALPQLGWEGVVWHHPDGRMAKLKARDFPAPDRTEEPAP